eukprot:UN04977
MLLWYYQISHFFND